MAKKHRSKVGGGQEMPAAARQALQPDYYGKFRCIASDCEDSCCIGWRVNIDRTTWQRYQSSTSSTLSPLFRDYIEVEERQDRRSAKQYASIRMQADRRCPFLRQDNLCSIHSELGAEALSDNCTSYPRIINLMGKRREYGLDVSCPEAARIALLHAEPTALVMGDASDCFRKREITNYSFACEAKGMPILDRIRSLILRILQWREVSIGARMMLLGALLNEIGSTQADSRFKTLAEIDPALDAYAALFADPAYVETEFGQLPADLPRKLECTTGFLADFLTSVEPRFRECVLAFSEGLLGGEMNGAQADATLLAARYRRIYADHYAPYFRARGYIYENYLVNEVFNGLFPFVGGNLLHLYRVMVFNLAIIQVMLVGMAGHYKGLDDARVIQFIQSFVRRSAHSGSYIDKLTEAVASKDSPSFVEVMWMLKEQ